MNTQTQEALKMAIEAFYSFMDKKVTDEDFKFMQWKACQACKEALEQPAMTYEQGFDHGYEAHKAEQENEKQKSIVNIWDEICELEQPAQEPVAWISNDAQLPLKEDGSYWLYPNNEDGLRNPLYTHPAPSWQGLSSTEYMVLASSFTDDENMVVDEIGFARAIEQELKEKNKC